MYVKEVRIENVRGFRSGDLAVNLDLTRPGKDKKLAGWTVIAGRNGAGKSSFLKSIALSIAGPSAARALQESFAGWIHSGAPIGSVATQVVPAEFDQFEKTGRRPSTFWTGLEWEKHAEGPEPALRSIDELNTKGRQAPRRGPWSDNPIGWFVAGYGPFRRLTGHASDAQRLMVGPKRIARLVSLFREDASLVECIQWLKDIYLRKLEDKSNNEWKWLLDGILHLLNDGLLPEGDKVVKIDSEGLWISRGEISLPLRELSDGYRTIAALVVDLARQIYDCYGEFNLITPDNDTGPWVVPYSGVVLIDEIDVHLHISWQQKIGFWLKEHFPAIQFLVTTHSPYICQAADPAGLIRLPAPGENEPAKHVAEDLFTTIVNGSTDDAAMTELFGLERTYSSKSEELRKHVAQLEARLIKGNASPKERQELRQLVEQLPKRGSSVVQQLLLGLTSKP
ncbi:hypothetical protein CYFUS_008805 [Cystobacter fuscus]|uniref:Uncharacterized protein n=1 Tax=Cystobacter fuscus TaxID=43 RepID=A0A250JHG2_9BACT|nr:AAA family ATPase [Cystobacter fuscus]ATB43325.1 hypothetical protein CYFUS_008805 [Cystobacter fuscus]